MKYSHIKRCEHFTCALWTFNCIFSLTRDWDKEKMWREKLGKKHNIQKISETCYHQHYHCKTFHWGSEKKKNMVYNTLLISIFSHIVSNDRFISACLIQCLSFLLFCYICLDSIGNRNVYIILYSFFNEIPMLLYTFSFRMTNILKYKTKTMNFNFLHIHIGFCKSIDTKSVFRIFFLLFFSIDFKVYNLNWKFSSVIRRKSSSYESKAFLFLKNLCWKCYFSNKTHVHSLYHSNRKSELCFLRKQILFNGYENDQCVCVLLKLKLEEEIWNMNIPHVLQLITRKHGLLAKFILA